MHNSLKDKVLEAIDIVEVVGERVPLTRKGREFVGLCPFHDDHKPSMAVSPQKQIFKCWSCGAGGDAIKFVQMFQRIEFRDALALLAQRAGIEMHSRQEDSRVAAARDQVRQALKWAHARFRHNLVSSPGGKAALEYARRRGLTDETIERLELGYAADAWSDVLDSATRAGVPNAVLHQAGLITTNDNGKTYDRFRHRLIFPINDGLGRCVAFGGRALGDDPAKYLNSPETVLYSKSRVLYGLDFARTAIQQERRAIIVEGYLDAVLLHQAGIRCAVATLGTALTDAHVKLLKPLADNLVMCFDSDEAGNKAADRAAETALKHRVNVSVAIVPDGEDPADCVLRVGRAGFEEILLSAQRALEFKWKSTLQAFGARGTRSRRDAVEAFVGSLGRITASGGIDPLEQGLLVSRLAELLSLPPERIYEMLARARAAAPRQAAVVRDREGTDAELSSYAASIRGLPVRCVAVVEEMFGLALLDPQALQDCDAALASASEHCLTWRRLYNILRAVVDRHGRYTRGQIVSCCEEADLCEMISRACECVGNVAATAENWIAARDRVLAELEIIRLRGESDRRSADPADPQDRERAFRSLLDVAQRQHGMQGQPGLLGVRHRLGAGAASD